MFIQPAKQHTTKPFIPHLCWQASIDKLQKLPRNYEAQEKKLQFPRWEIWAQKRRTQGEFCTKTTPILRGNLFVLKGESENSWRCRQTPSPWFPQEFTRSRGEARDTTKISLLPNAIISRKSYLKWAPVCWGAVQVATTMTRDVLPACRGATSRCPRGAPKNSPSSQVTAGFALWPRTAPRWFTYRACKSREKSISFVITNPKLNRKARPCILSN